MQKRKRVLGAAIGTMLSLGLLINPNAELSPVYGADAPVAIDETNFPDVALRSRLMLYDLDGNSILSVDEIEAITGIAVNGATDLTGIGYLTHLKELHCLGCQLSSLDVSQNTALEKLEFIYSCSLTSLDVSRNINLKELNCAGIQISSLDVSQNVNLKELNCASNQLSSLDVSQNVNLEKLICSGNQISSLDVSQNINLKELNCDNNNLNSLDVSQNTALERLDCENNNLNSLDVSRNTALKVLVCDGNNLSSLDVSKNTALTALRCYNNNLCSLDVTQNTVLSSYACNGNEISLPLYQSGSEYYIDLSSLPLDTGRVISSSVGSYNAENGHIEGLTLDINDSSLTYRYNTGFHNDLMNIMIVTVNISGEPIKVEVTEEPSTEGTTEKQDSVQTTEVVPTENTQAEKTSQNTPKTGDTMLPVWIAILGLFSTISYLIVKKRSGIK